MERIEDAQREFEQALRLDPKCPGAYMGIGWVEGRKGD
jgi:cytochrome c-type biogenesis protein CcmH/NrfG